MTASGDGTQAASELNSHRQQYFFCGSPPLPEPFGRRLSIVLSRRSQLAGVEVQKSVTAMARDILLLAKLPKAILPKHRGSVLVL